MKYEIICVGNTFYVIAKRHESDSEIVKLTEEQKRDPFKHRPYWTYPSPETFAHGPFSTRDTAAAELHRLEAA